MNERRLDGTRGEWVTFATHRQNRTFLPSAADCPLCPTRDPERPTEIERDDFEIAVFDNRFPPFASDPAPPARSGTDEFPVAPAPGAAEVVVYGPDHNLTLSDMSAAQLRALVEVWAERYRVLGSRPEIEYVFIFENRGEQVGVTLHHPHGQVYGFPSIPPIPARELQQAREALARTGNCIFCEQVTMERADAVRVVAQTTSMIAFVPFAARFPYEIRITTRRHAPSLLDLSDPERDELAEILGTIVRSYDALFGFPLPYVMGIHQMPTSDGIWGPVSHFHIELCPPHRTAEKLKYLAGSELAAGAFLNDVMPEEAAASLRAAMERSAT